MESQNINQSQNKITKQENFNKSFAKVEKYVSKIDFDKLLYDVENSEKDSRQFIFDSINKEIDPNSDVVQNFNVRSRSMRKIGNRFLNLFRITFTIEFAGVMLVNFTIPKITDDEK